MSSHWQFSSPPLPQNLFADSDLGTMDRKSMAFRAKSGPDASPRYPGVTVIQITRNHIVCLGAEPGCPQLLFLTLQPSSDTNAIDY